MTPLDRAWLDRHPLPGHGAETDKNSRGRVLLAGGSERVPGALRLTAEAAFRAGAGKVQMATVERVAIMLGLLVPEAAAIPLPTDEGGEIAAAAAPILLDAADHADCLILGPGMAEPGRAAALVEAVLARPREDLSILLDAAAVACASRIGDALAGHGGRAVLTPHHGEMAALTGEPIEAIAADPERTACRTARKLNAVIVLKSGSTIVATPDGDTLRFPGGGIGLATGGSGDVLAGIIGGLLSRGAAPFTAAAWGVWLHGEAGRGVSERLGPIGLLARELPGEVATLMRGT